MRSVKGWAVCNKPGSWGANNIYITDAKDIYRGITGWHITHPQTRTISWEQATEPFLKDVVKWPNKIPITILYLEDGYKVI